MDGENLVDAEDTKKVGTTIKFRGEELTLRGLVPSDYRKVEAHLRSTRRNPLDAIKGLLGDLPPEVAKELALKAYEDARKGAVITTNEIAEWIDSLDGLAWTIHTGLKKEYGDRFSLDDVAEILDELAEAELKKLKAARDEAARKENAARQDGREG